MERGDEHPSDRARMIEMINGFMTASVINATAKLKIADRLASGPKTPEELARLTSTRPEQLRRLLRALTSIGVLFKADSKRFGLTRLGATLQSGSPGSLRDRAVLISGDEHYRAWGNLMYSLKTGRTAFDGVFGVGLWDYLSSHPSRAAAFDRGMASGARSFLGGLATRYPFGSFKKVVDVGGGDGTLLASILRAHPRLRGVLFDQPHAAEQARDKIRAQGLSGRCEAVGGSFMGPIPSGGDLYLISRVLHDWSDERCVAILRNCRGAVKSGKLLVVERILEPEYDSSPSVAAALSDLNMLVVTGGKERTVEEYRSLLEEAGFRYRRVFQLDSPFCAIEAVPLLKPVGAPQGKARGTRLPALNSGRPRR